MIDFEFRLKKKNFKSIINFDVFTHKLSTEAHNKKFKGATNNREFNEIRKCEKQRINWKFEQNNKPQRWRLLHHREALL